MSIDINKQLEAELAKFTNSEQATNLTSLFGDHLPLSYLNDFSLEEIASDILNFSKINGKQNYELDFDKTKTELNGNCYLKLYQSNQVIPLSDVLPIVEHLGLRTLTETPYRFVLSKNKELWLGYYLLQYPDVNAFKYPQVKKSLSEVFSGILKGEIENDDFNRLILSAKLTHREVMVFRSIAKFLHQIQFRYEQAFIETVVNANPEISTKLIQYFKNKFDPNLSEAERSTYEKTREELLVELDKVTDTDHDRVLRTILQTIDAITRTNYFSKDKNGKNYNYFTYKFESRKLPNLPLPYPMYEIFVYSKHFEGVHLRTSKIARGGIRWSDRHQDYRTEILGLMKAQNVKNSLIVPSGAKGGFVIKSTLSTDRVKRQNEIESNYKEFISALLELADNLVNGHIHHPKNVVCYDDDDSYFVVAADKGTATFSDLANSISLAHHFWLEDAFASGSSTGYDHKKLAVTSKGAWESAKHHFRELHIDVSTDTFTAVGIGDMSGDVFGNGMLRSKNIKLIGAFDHRSIFVDPNPDCLASYNERLRLFTTPGSSWDDYDKKVLSEGGRIYSRRDKKVFLTPQIKEVLGLETDELEPDELVRELLKARVDLIWNGGIGTFIKAEVESNDKIGDRTNDHIRVNGKEVRSRIIVEGGNLGLSQAARIEYALNGGKVFCDFVDNAGGVHCSDREVNLKILFGQLISEKIMNSDARNELLQAMTQDVLQSVIADNHDQALAIAVARLQSDRQLDLYNSYINYMVKNFGLNRINEGVPNEDEISRRKMFNIGLTNPELSVLQSYEKNRLKAVLVKSTLLDDPFFNHYLREYFPTILNEKFAKNIMMHPLRKELIATRLSNELVNTMGILYIYRTCEEMHTTIEDVVRSYVIASTIFKTPDIYNMISRFDDAIHIEEQYEMFMSVRALLSRSTYWFLQKHWLNMNLNTAIAYFSSKVDQLFEIIPDIMIGATRQYLQEITEFMTKRNLDISMARRISACRAMYTSLNIIEIATENNFDISLSAQTYLAVGELFDLVWFRDRLNMTAQESHWRELGNIALRQDLDTIQKNITILVMKSSAKLNISAKESVQRWMTKYSQVTDLWKNMLNDLRAMPTPEFAMFFVATKELAKMIKTYKKVS